MNKFYLLLLFCATLFNGISQPSSLDHTFGNKGIQTTAFFSDANLLDERGRAVLTSANGDVFIAVLVGDARSSYTRIAKYLPDGRPDSSYGNAGYSDAVKLDVNCAAFQGDKIIVAGQGNYYNNDFILARYTADGKLDSSFGVNGRVKTDFNGSGDLAYAIVLQGDKIIVGGHTFNAIDRNEDFALARYTADGSLDSSFGENGIVTTDFNNSTDEANSIALQGDKIILAGSSNYADFALARYTADGKLDSSFGVNGKVTTDFYNSDDEATSIVIQGNKIIAAGYSGYSDFALARYTADGVLDSSFGENGKVTTGFDKSDAYAYSAALQGDKIMLAGETYSYASGGSYDFALARYTADGVLDSSFGANGKVTTDFRGLDDQAYSMALQGDNIIVAGFTQPTDYSYDFALARYTADGALDNSFGVNGKLTGHFPSSHTFFAGAAIQGNKIVAAGSTGDYHDKDFVLARYTADGVLDSAFGENGLVTTDFHNSDDDANSIVLQGNKIIVAGSAEGYSEGYYRVRFALARYTADGKLDSTFGKSGKVTTDFDKSDAYAYTLALQGDKILLAGESFQHGTSLESAFALARYTADGALDSSFGENGKVTTVFTSSYNGARSIALQGDKIIAGGSSNYDFVLARYTADGILDSTFGENGKVITSIGSDDEANSIVIHGDKIIVSGYTEDYPNTDFALLRYSADGVLDSTFGENGIVTTDFNHFGDRANSVAIQGDKIIAGGYSYNSFSSYDFALVRYTADGSLDSSFGKNGKVTTHLHHSSSIGGIALYQNRLYAVGSLTIFTGENYGIVAAYQLETPEPAISIADVTVSESGKLAVVTVRLSKPADKLVRVHFTTRDKTAVHNEDYLPISGPLFFIPGINNTAKIFIPIIDDNTTEGDEQFEIVLSDAHNATIQDSVGVVTIIDNDAAPIAKENTSLHMNVSPNPSASIFTVQLQGSNFKQPASIRIYDVSGRMIEQRENISIGQSIRLGEQYKTGTYIIEAVQGSQKLQTKVIKTGQ